MLDTRGCKHTLRIFNTYCFSTATVAAQTGLSVMLYVNYVSFFLIIVIACRFYMLLQLEERMGEA